MRDDRLGPINPYYTHQSCVYPYFYTMQIEGKPILDVLYEMLSSMPMPKFMEKSYQLCVEHETEIRRHIEGRREGRMGIRILSSFTWAYCGKMSMQSVPILRSTCLLLRREAISPERFAQCEKRMGGLDRLLFRSCENEQTERKAERIRVV